MPANELLDSYAETDIAIVGMSGRFPGADTPGQLWENVVAGVESVTFFSERRLAQAGVKRALLRDPHYVRAAPILKDASLFDASFFGYSPREAKTMDPQQRIFLECAWEALEQAGYHGDGFEGPIGVFAGSAMNTYILQLALRNKFFEEYLPTLLGNDKDFLATRASYKLNLRGPSVTIQTACSSSLVAVHMACQSLLSEECDMALAGGVSVRVPQLTGYLHEEGSVFSPDGHCRPFDARAQGTIFGSGGGVVAMKRLSDAIDDEDHVWAIVKGSAINNDGSDKSDYTAPSVRQQARAIAEAHTVSAVDPETITYVEAHGTGTYLGDPIEVAALSMAFREGTPKNQFCAIGSLKSNIGHLDAAAGVAGLIKTAYALKTKTIPPTINFEAPNPEINFGETPFYVATERRDWDSGPTPRRAGVQSLGMGGTNAHVVLEEAPSPAPRAEAAPKPRLYFLSAKSEAACAAAARDLGAATAADPSLRLDDVAHTLRTGRAVFGVRAAVVAASREALSAAAPKPMRARSDKPSISFLFSGQGAQYPTMTQGLYAADPLFRTELDRCLDGFEAHLSADLRALLFPVEADRELAATHLKETVHAQAALFCVEYALARRWMAWGVRPDHMLGHSIGEYVAATIAGVFELDAAIQIVAARGRLMQSCEAGSMLAVFAPQEEVAPRLGDGLCVAVVNTVSGCVVSGDHAAIDALQQRLESEGIQASRLHTSHAFHSPMMAPIYDAFVEAVSAHKLSPPEIPFVSNLSGTWITPEQATSPRYWADHIVQPVRFSEGLGALFAAGADTLIEVGPGKTLCAFAQQHPDIGEAIVLPSARHPKETAEDEAFLLTSLGALWSAGVALDREAICAEDGARAAPLPTYPFERQSFWIEDAPADAPAGAGEARRPSSEWLYAPTWTPAPLTVTASSAASGPWLIFADALGVGAALERRLAAAGADVTMVEAGDAFDRLSGTRYRIDPSAAQDYERLIDDLKAADRLPERIAHLWALTGPQPGDDVGARLAPQRARGDDSLMSLAARLAAAAPGAAWSLLVASDGLQSVGGAAAPFPEKATMLGVTKLIPVEFAPARCCSLDVAGSPRADVEPASLADAILAEFDAGLPDDLVALAQGVRRTRAFEPIDGAEAEAGAALLRQGGVYVIFGGFGGVGLEIARRLAADKNAKLALVGRTAPPPREDWARWRDSHPADDPTSQKIETVQELERLGADVLTLAADVAERREVVAALDAARARFGALHGVIHSAGVADAAGPLEMRARERHEAVLRSKVAGCLALDDALQGVALDFLALNSSIAAELYRNFWGQAGYVAANSFVDAFAAYRSARSPDQKTLAINWDDWDLGMSRAAEEQYAQKTGQADFQFDARNKMREGEGVDAFLRALGQNRPRVVVSVRDLDARLAETGGDALFGGDDAAARAAGPAAGGGAGDIAAMAATIETVWKDALGHISIDHDANFFEIGGHSLLGVTLLRDISRETGVTLRLAALYEAPTIRLLAERVLSEAGGAATAPRRPSAHATPKPNGAAPPAGALPVISATTASPQHEAPRTTETPKKSRDEGAFRGMINRLLQVIALYAPGMSSFRVWLHRKRGVSMGKNVSIGTAVHIETAYPWLVKIGDNVQISQHTIIIGHFRDMTQASKDQRRPTVVIEDNAFVGPGSILMPNITIGHGAVVAAGTVVSQSVEPYTVVQGNPARAIARSDAPLANNDFATFTQKLEALSTETEVG